jgi:orotate phosphoribosyltransferase
MKSMEEYKKRFSRVLAETGALFFAEKLVLKDGRPTPYFVNMAMFRTGRLSLEMGRIFAGMIVSRGIVNDVDIILGPSYKGSAIALATSIALWEDYGYDLLFEYDRKEAKTHGEATSVKGMFVNNTFFNDCRIFVVDDVATSMGTKYDLLDKIKAEAHDTGIECRVAGIGIGIDREQTTAVYEKDGSLLLDQKGENAIMEFVDASGVPVYSAAKIREVVGYLYEEKIPVMIQGRFSLIDEKLKDRFDNYFKTYGID